MKTINSILALLVAVGSSMVSFTLNGSFFWAALTFFFWPFCWIKWLVCQDVNLTILKETFSFLGG